MTITYPLLTVVDDSGAVVTGATVTVASITDKAGTAISSPGDALNTGADPFISIDYDSETHGEAVVTLSISKVGSTITGLNAAPRFYLAKDSSRILTNLDAQVSTRSTYAGGPVAGVTAPVTVGTVNDKVGYSMAPSGWDSIVIETGVNPRQAMSVILAACGGLVSGAGTGAIVIKGGNTSTTRINATTDTAGNRSSVTLTLPN